MTARRALMPCVVLACLWTGAVARADNAKEAADFFRAAHAAYDRKDYSAAARAFDAAYAIAPRPEVAYNAARAWELAGDAAHAADDFALALSASSPDVPWADDARTRLKSLERTTALLHVTSEPGSHATVAHVTDGAVPLAIHVDPGPYDVAVRAADGRSARVHVVPTAATETTVDVVLPAKPPPPLPPPPAAKPPPTRGSWMRPAGYVGLGLGVAAAGAAVGFGVLTLNERQTFLDSHNTDASSHDSAVLYRTLTNVAWITAAAASVTGLVLVLAAPKSQATTGVIIAPGVIFGTF